MNSKKYLIISITISTLLLFGFGITYARFTYNRTGVNNKLILGDIYMHYKETNSINMEGAMPLDISKYSKYVHNSNIADAEVNACMTYFQTSNSYGTNFIEYLNTTGESLETFCDGSGTADGYTFQEILDINGFSSEDLSYFSENNIIKVIVHTLPYFEFTIDGKNTYEKEDIWYEIVLTHGDNHATRTERISDNLLKFRLVEVVDGEEQELLDNKSYSDLTSKRIWVDTISANTTSEIEKTYRLYMWISDETIIGNTSDANYDMDTWSNQVYASIKVDVTGDFVKKEVAYEDRYDVTDASCFTTISANFIYNNNVTDAEVSLCANYLTSIYGAEENFPIDGETYESYCRGTGTFFGDTFQERLDYDKFSTEDLIYFTENNIIIADGKNIVITDYDTSCGSDVIIPKTINDYNVTEIDENAFSKKQLTSVVIPGSVTYIGSSAFYDNQLTSVTIENGVEEIHWRSFMNNNITSVIIPDSVVTLYCGAFDDTVEITVREDLGCYDVVT